MTSNDSTIIVIPASLRNAPSSKLIHPLHRQAALRSIKNLAPLLDRVLVQRIKADTKTAGGIFLPETAVKELNEAKVLAVGPGAFDKEGKRIAMGVAAGDRVLIPQVSCCNGT
jgi:chaperonin GroES